MALSFKKSKIKIGLVPGAVIYTGTHDDSKPADIDVYKYNEQKVEKFKHDRDQMLSSYIASGSTNWINIVGLHDTDTIKKMGEEFNFHPLLLEDLVNTFHMPKFESFGDYVSIILKMAKPVEKGKDYIYEHVCFILGNGFVMSLQETGDDPFGHLRERIEKKIGKIRMRGNDYLFYNLVDLTIDQLFHVTTSLEERISLMEEQLMKGSQEVGLEDIVRLKQDLIRFRKVVIPLEGEIRKLLKDESNMIDDNYSVFINDILDHVRQLDSSSGYFRETIVGLFELHQTNLANRMNQVMKVLTIIATIFIPLTFLAGIYGMNFTNMPELSWRWSYPILLMVMFLLGFGMFLWMKRRNWF